jgi:hypothetical protein
MGDPESVTNPPRSEFQVRFTRARGLAALFERPTNSYRWSGRGILRVETRGVHFQATRRRLMGLRQADTRFVVGHQIRNVYREADGVRVDFRENAHYAFLSFWAEDSAAAAAIVQLLPTARTVEVEDTPPRKQSRRHERAVRTRIAVTAVAGLVIVAGGTWIGVRLSHLEPFRRPTPAAAQGQRDSGQSITSGAMAAGQGHALRADFRQFADRSAALQAQFRTAFAALQEGSLSQEDFSEGLERWLIPQWTSEQNRLRQDSFPAGSRRETLRTHLTAVALNWQRALETYADGLRVHDPEVVGRAFAFMAVAEESERRAQAVLEQPPEP